MTPISADVSRDVFHERAETTFRNIEFRADARLRNRRKHGISDATFYKYKAKYGGMDVSDARKLKALEDENAKLKKLLAEAMLDNAILKDVAAKKW